MRRTWARWSRWSNESHWPKADARLRTPKKMSLDTLYEDAMIAATAAVRLTVVTRNVADFAKVKVWVLNPFKPPKT